MEGFSNTGSGGIKQPIAIRHLLTTKPFIAKEVGRSLESIPFGTSSRHGNVCLEKEMDSSAENLFRDWEAPVRRRERPPRSLTPDGKQRIRAELLDEPHAFTEFLGDSGDDSFEEASLQRRPLYVDCVETGRRKFRMEFDAEGFGKENISVTLAAARLEIRAVQEETEGGRKSTSEFCRRIKLPADVDRKRLSCELTDGKIVIEAPLIQKSIRHRPITPSSSSSSSRLPAGASSLVSGALLNVPVVKSQDGANVLSLTVEIGRVFRSNDVTVKLRNPLNIVITAERFEQTSFSRLSAKLEREFDLPAKIIPQTLKAGMTVDGLLKITAHLQTGTEETDE